MENSIQRQEVAFSIQTNLCRSKSPIRLLSNTVSESSSTTKSYHFGYDRTYLTTLKPPPESACCHQSLDSRAYRYRLTRTYNSVSVNAYLTRCLILGGDLQYKTPQTNNDISSSQLVPLIYQPAPGWPWRMRPELLLHGSLIADLAPESSPSHKQAYDMRRMVDIFIKVAQTV